jgi:hypothetical protein
MKLRLFADIDLELRVRNERNIFINRRWPRIFSKGDASELLIVHDAKLASLEKIIEDKKSKNSMP